MHSFSIASFCSFNVFLSHSRMQQSSFLKSHCAKTNTFSSFISSVLCKIRARNAAMLCEKSPEISEDFVGNFYRSKSYFKKRYIFSTQPNDLEKYHYFSRVLLINFFPSNITTYRTTRFFNGFTD